MTVRIPISRSRAMRSRMPGFGTSDNAITPRTCPSTDTAKGVAPRLATRSATHSEVRRFHNAERFHDMVRHGIDGAFTNDAAVGEIEAAHARLRREIQRS